jgi:nitroimidazol reductase NimA-like FMN-containing flavoprotein (pyridoxamine 5'-phosphate oxidase superfamily)
MSDSRATGALAELSPEECLQLLAAFSIGRLAVAVPDSPPLVVPVNYVLDGDVVVFRSDAGSKLSALRQHPVSFQLDSIDPLHRTGWSVLIQGIAYEATSHEIAHLNISPWAPGEKSHWVRILPAIITGRVISFADEPGSSRGYL